MIRRVLNYLIMTQPGCHHQRCALRSQPGCDVSLSSQLMKTPFENPWAERIRTEKNLDSCFVKAASIGAWCRESLVHREGVVWKCLHLQPCVREGARSPLLQSENQHSGTSKKTN